MKKIGKYLGMAAGLSVLMLGTAGCEKEVETAVVAEKNVNAASMENGAQEDIGAIEYFDEVEDISPMMSLKEQVSAPATYTADFEEHREFVEGEESTGREMTVHVTADASVEIPEAEYVRLKKIRTAVNSEEQVKAWLEALCDDEEEFLKSWEKRETETYGQEQKLEIVDGKMKIDGVPYRFQYDREV